MHDMHDLAGETQVSCDHEYWAATEGGYGLVFHFNNTLNQVQGIMFGQKLAT